MKLLLDENLSPRLADSLANIYPGSKHVSGCGLAQTADFLVWDFAKANGFVIATKDSDFEHLALLRGQPPKVIQLRLGNCTTQVIGETLRKYSVVIHTFDLDPVEALLVLP